MDFQVKQWREQQQQHHHRSEQEQQQQLQQPHYCAKLPTRLILDSNNIPQQQQQQHYHQNTSDEASALPLFVPDEPTSKLSSSNLSAYLPDSTVTATKYPTRMGSYFSLAQWQELELQALIFRHMLAGAPVPPELLHLVKKSLLASSPYYLPHPLQNHPYYQQSMLQSGYWGRAAMDPEPGRCRRTDGKKWRCSRDVVAGHKYCERHMHRGRNRSRKPVEVPTPTANPSGGNNNAAASGILKNSSIVQPQPLEAVAAGGGVDGGGGKAPNFSLSGSSPSIDLLHLCSNRPSESMMGNKDPFGTQSEGSAGEGKSGGKILRHFFDDWPRSLQDSDNAGSNISSVTSVTNLSISTPGESNPSSDFSLKLSTGGNGDENDHQQSGSVDHNRHHSHWGTPWGTNQVASMGGPLAEALRSSTSSSSPTSVLHQLGRRTTSEASYITT